MMATPLDVEYEFDFTADSAVIDRPLPARGPRQIMPPDSWLRIRLAHRQTGQSAEVTMRNFSVIDPAAPQGYVRKLILESFPDSACAQKIHRENNNIPVELISAKDLSGAIGEGFHVALRKYTTGPASAVWWNLISKMPSRMYGLICEKTAFDLLAYSEKSRQQGRAMKLAACIRIAKNSWESTLDLARMYFDKSRDAYFIEDLRRSHAGSFEGAVWPVRGDLTLYQMDDLAQSSQEAYIAIRLLTTENWAGMLSTVVKEIVPEPGLDAHERAEGRSDAGTPAAGSVSSTSPSLDDFQT